MAVVVALGVVAGAYLLGRAGGGDASAEIARLDAQLARLTEEFATERRAREELARALEATRARLDVPVASAAGSPESAAPPPREPIPAAVNAPDPALEVASRGEGRVDPDRLIGVGFSRGEVEAYTEFLDDLALRGLELRDQATREGWLETRRYREERAALHQERLLSRERFGDELYDWALFSSGQSNRMRIDSVIGGSVAEEAGLQAGDIVQRYADAPVIGYEDLRLGTSSGRAGDLTPIDVLRKGQEMRLYVPRGPLGVQLKPAKVKPEPVR